MFTNLNIILLNMQLQNTTLLQGGKYRMEKVLGQGGFGITYLATQMSYSEKSSNFANRNRRSL